MAGITVDDIKQERLLEAARVWRKEHFRGLSVASREEHVLNQAISEFDEPEFVVHRSKGEFYGDIYLYVVVGRGVQFARCSRADMAQEVADALNAAVKP